MKHIFIINPIAGKGKSLKIIPYIKQCFENSKDELIIEITEYSGHALKLAREYSTIERCRIYSVGGDGTLNEVVNGIAGTDSALGIIPTGSGNDFVRNFRAYSNINDMIKATIKGTERSIDLAQVNDKYFINISSIGFDANVVYNADKFKKVPGISGSMAYLISIVYTMFVKKICSISIDIDGIKTNKKLLLAAIANGKYYGGGMIPTPDARVDDGLLDICMVSEVNRLQILKLFPKYIKGLHTKLKQASFHKCKNVIIESQEELSLNIDGEIISEKKINIKILESYINVIFPEA